MKIKTNLIELVEADVPPFHNNELKLFREWEPYLLFQKKEILEKNASVDIRKVIGDKKDFGPSWGQLLHNKRVGRKGKMELNYLELQQNPDYYLGHEPKSNWSFICLDGIYFIDEGTHRTTIAKYLEYYNPDLFDDGKIHGVTVSHYETNREAMTARKDIEMMVKTPGLQHLEFTQQFDHRLYEIYFTLRSTKQHTDQLKFGAGDLQSFADVLRTHCLYHRLFGNELQRYLFRKGWFWRLTGY